MKKGGFTREMEAYSEATEEYQRGVVALRRADEAERLRRVGPAGGTWGAARPAAALREPLHLSTVVSAAEAKRGGGGLPQAPPRGPAAAPLFGASRGDAATSMGTSATPSASVRLRASSPSSRPLRSRQASPGARGVEADLRLASGGGLTPRSLLMGEASAEEAPLASGGGGGTWLPLLPSVGGAGADETLTDYLPALPYAKGATLTLGRRDKPIGMVT